MAFIGPRPARAAAVVSLVPTRSTTNFTDVTPRFPAQVGEVAIASSDVYMAGGRGRFLKAVHHYRDCLWSLPEHKGVVPNEGYYINGVGPTGGAEQVRRHNIFGIQWLVCVWGHPDDGNCSEASSDLHVTVCVPGVSIVTVAMLRQDIEGQLDEEAPENEGGDAGPGPCGMADEPEEGVASLSLGPSPAEESPQQAEEPAEDMDSLVGRVFLQVTA